MKEVGKPAKADPGILCKKCGCQLDWYVEQAATKQHMYQSRCFESLLAEVARLKAKVSELEEQGRPQTRKTENPWRNL